MADRFLIVNADDFGMSDGINAGVIQAHRHGIVTSASLMVKRARSAEAAALARTAPKLGLGLHIDLAEWEPVDGDWRQTYARVNLDDAAQVAREITEQLELFISLVGRAPDHLDSHQHVHLEGHARRSALQLASEIGVPLRGLDDRVAFCGDFYGQQDRCEPYPEGITVANLLRIVERITTTWTELMCHPGYAYDVGSVYARERESELATLCDPALESSLVTRGVQLRWFSDAQSDISSHPSSDRGRSGAGKQR